MGFTPATGQEISIGCVYTAFGLTPIPGSNIGLNSTLGVNRQPPQAQGVTAITAGAVTTLSADMGGLDTPQNYCDSLIAFFKTTGFTGWNVAGSTGDTVCTTGGTPGNLYFTSPGPANWLAATGRTIYSSSQLTTPFNGNNQWYKDGVTQCANAFQINSSGVIINTFDCFQLC